MVHYDSIGGNEPDGILYSVLDLMQTEYNITEEKDDWLKMVCLKLMHVTCVIRSNTIPIPTSLLDLHMMLLTKMCYLNIWTSWHNNKIAVSENRAQQYLIFMINRWEKNAKPMKFVVARYAVASGVSSTLLLSELPKIICGL